MTKKQVKVRVFPIGRTRRRDPARVMKRQPRVTLFHRRSRKKDLMAPVCTESSEYYKSYEGSFGRRQAIKVIFSLCSSLFGVSRYPCLTKWTDPERDSSGKSCSGAVCGLLSLSGGQANGSRLCTGVQDRGGATAPFIIVSGMSCPNQAVRTKGPHWG